MYMYIYMYIHVCMFAGLAKQCALNGYMYIHALGVLCCFALFVCLTLLASFFLPSHLSFKNMYIHLYSKTLSFK